MKKLILVLAVLSSTLVFPQKSYNQFSVDINYGVSLPLTPIPDGRKVGDFAGASHFMLGARYMIIPELGFKLSYAHDKFQDINLKDNNLVYSRYNIQVVSNLVYLFDFQGHLWEEIGLLAHAGGGIVTANPSGSSVNERVGNLVFGINPLYKLSDKFAISADLSYILTTKQHYSFGGQLLNPDFEYVTGGFINFSVGLKYYIGKNRDHADWR